MTGVNTTGRIMPPFGKDLTIWGISVKEQIMNPFMCVLKLIQYVITFAQITNATDLKGVV